MIKTKLSRNQIRLISFALFTVAVLSVLCLKFYLSAKTCRLQLELTRQHAMTELCESMDAITTALQKTTFTASETTMEKLSASLSGEARCAKIALSEISDDLYTDDIYKFLSQVGAYTGSITTKLSSGSAQEDAHNLAKLLSYSQSITEALEKVASDYFDGTVTFEQSRRSLQFYENEAPELFSAAVTDLQQSFADYPTLIYDGPFSDHLGNKESVYLKNAKEYSKQEALSYAAQVLQVDEGTLRDMGDEEGAVHLYCFSSGNKTIGITKKGRRVCYILDSGYAGESSIDEETAVSKAKEYLSQLGYKSMTSSYYSVYDGVCTVNFAYNQNGVICYPDLIKVSISLDSGEMAALDARTYLANHTEHSTDFTLTEAEARARINKALDIISVRKSVIPTEAETEYSCYEVHCSDTQGNEALIYIDGKTGQEREILLMTYSDGGVLAK